MMYRESNSTVYRVKIACVIKYELRYTKTGIMDIVFLVLMRKRMCIHLSQSNKVQVFEINLNEMLEKVPGSTWQDLAQTRACSLLLCSFASERCSTPS